MGLDPELLAVLACPTCKGSLAVVGETEGLLCERCSVVYPVREEIPIMLADEAVPARQWEEGRREAPAVPPAD